MAACVRSATPSLLRIVLTWFRTVPSEGEWSPRCPCWTDPLPGAPAPHARAHLAPPEAPYRRVIPNTSGTQQNLSDTVRGIGASLLLSIILVFLLMVALYNSYSAPFIVMFTVPLAAVGALGALALTHETLNIFSMIGTVLLIGLVAKNGILLVDFANQAQDRGRDRRAAIREAAVERLRPIIMTTFAMVFGMLPLALGLEPGGNQRSALGIVMIGGLLSSLVLSLLVVPIVYVALGPRSKRERDINR